MTSRRDEKQNRVSNASAFFSSLTVDQCLVFIDEESESVKDPKEKRTLLHAMDLCRAFG